MIRYQSITLAFVLVALASPRLVSLSGAAPPPTPAAATRPRPAPSAVSGPASTGPSATCPATATAPSSTQPSTRPALDPRAEALLDQIQAAQAATRTLTAELTYDREQGLQADRQRRFGQLVFESGPPAKFALRFDRLLIDKRLQREELTFLCDGRWLVEKRINDKQFFKRQIVAPDVPVEKADPLRLGEGPFPIPLGLDKARVAAKFVAAVIDAKPDDPPGAVHLRLTPRPDRPSELTQIDFWFNRQTLSPVRGEVVDESENRTVIQLKNATTNAALPPDAFDVSEPSDPGWRIEVTPWK